MNTPAGWYPHPENPGFLRWWDGIQWTDETQLLTPPAPPKRKKGLAVAAAILAALGVILLFNAFLSTVLLVTSMALAVAALARKQRLKVLSIACLCIAPLAFFVSMVSSSGKPSANSDASDPVAVVASDYKEMTDRELALIVKDPDDHEGERLVIYAKVTQFDSATGECSFRGTASAVPVDSSWDYKENIFLLGGSGGVPCDELKDYVEDDEIRVLATSQGEVQYETAMRASMSAPQFRIDKIERLTE